MVSPRNSGILPNHKRFIDFESSVAPTHRRTAIQTFFFVPKVALETIHWERWASQGCPMGAGVRQPWPRINSWGFHDFPSELSGRIDKQYYHYELVSLITINWDVWYWSLWTLLSLVVASPGMMITLHVWYHWVEQLMVWLQQRSSSSHCLNTGPPETSVTCHGVRNDDGQRVILRIGVVSSWTLQRAIHPCHIASRSAKELISQAFVEKPGWTT